MIAFAALNKEGEHIEFAYDLKTIEAEFDFLSSLVAKGHTLLTVQLLENCGRTNLPLAAFDGMPLSNFIEELHQEWQVILDQPCQPGSPCQEELIRLTRLRIVQLGSSIASHERMISCTRRWLQRTQTSYLSDFGLTTIISRYEAMIDLHERQLRQAQFRSLLAVNRLSHLLAQVD